MFNVIAIGLLAIAAAVIWLLLRALENAEQRAAHAESEAALKYSQGYQDGSAEQYTKLQREIEGSFQKGACCGYDAAIEEAQQPTHICIRFLEY